MANEIQTWMLLSDRLRTVETEISAVRHTQIGHTRDTQNTTRLLYQTAETVNHIETGMTDIKETLSTIITWARRLLLAGGILALNSGHITADTFAKFVTKLLGF